MRKKEENSLKEWEPWCLRRRLGFSALLNFMREERTFREQTRSGYYLWSFIFLETEVSIYTLSKSFLFFLI